MSVGGTGRAARTSPARTLLAPSGASVEAAGISAGAGPDAVGRITLQLEASALGLSDVRGLRRLTGGSSHETWAFDARLTSESGVEFVPFILRREFELPLFDMSIETEFELLRRLHSAGLSVPRPYFVSTGNAQADVPFMVMEQIAGLDIRKTMAADPDPNGRRAIGVAMVDALARVHAQPIEPLRDLLGEGSGLAELEKWRAIVLASGYRSAALHLALAWLQTHIPAQVQPVIVHGDYKANNVLLEEGMRPVIIDWELAHIGDRLEDLAWTMLWSTPDDLVGGMLAPVEFLSEYERASGVAIDSGLLHFWKLFSLVKLAAIFLKGIESGPDGRQPRPLLLMLAQALPCIEEALAELMCRGPGRGAAT
jgi:aminoglycoside phosphotransferase (APT) family kinase protein